MKSQRSQGAKLIGLNNISLKRRLRIYYDRFSIGFKITSVILLYLLFFTNYLSSFKSWISNHTYDVTADNGMVLENVIIEGHSNLLPSDIAVSLNADVGTPILSINLDKVREDLTKNQWVKNALIERRFPNTIYIGITERIPIVIWQNDKKLYLVDEEGSVISPHDITKFVGLIHVIGSDAPIYGYSLKKALEKDNTLRKRVVSCVRYGERRWNLILEQDITVKMPEYDFDRAYKYLSELNENNKLFDQNYKVIDLRDKEKYFLEKHNNALSPK